MLAERRAGVDRVEQRPDEPRGAYLKRRKEAKLANPRPAPPSRTYRQNDSYQRHRGYFYKDAAGRWRTPDGHIARGQRLIPSRSKPDERIWTLPRATTHNDRHRAKLVREDAYLSLLSYGFTLSRAKYGRIVGKAQDRETILARVRRARERGAIRHENERASRIGPGERARRDTDDTDDAPRATPDEGPDRGTDDERAQMRAQDDDADDETYERIPPHDRTDDWHPSDMEPDDFFESWEDDIEGDAGDTP